VQATQLSKSFGAETVLDGVGFRLDPGDRVALVGRNGAGKTTLLRILAGQLPADGGQVSLPRGARVALHDQRPPLGADLTLEAYVAQGVQGAEEAERDLTALEARMAKGESGPAVLAAYEEAQARLERAGGYAWRSWMERVLRGLGISEDELPRPLPSFSGGELTRASLARALVSRPDVLLLDEPTNHLDLVAVEWLERALADLGAAVMLVSHDRWFLESVATAILELDRGRARLWPMRYSAFRRERALAAERQGAAAERQAAEIARLERFVVRWRAGTKARQAASRQKRLDRMPRVEAPRREAALAFGFPRAERSARVVLEVDGLDVEVPGRRLIEGAGFAVERGHRLAVVGPNGTGKTTLLETLVGRRPQARGRVSLGHRVALSYFSQHGEDMPGDRTVLEAVLARSDLTPGQARTLLGSFLFPGDMVDRKVEKLSGGERRRLGLVGLLSRGGNLLVLDEPTNHLDTESREALEAALEAYDGTVVMVSHDRALIDAIATHTLALEGGRATMRLGGYTDLLRAREDVEAAPAPRPAVRERRRPERRPAEAPRAPARLQREVRRIETRIASLESEIAAVEGELADPAVLADHERLAERGARHRELQQELTWAMREWEMTAEAASG